ncbi:MAG: hypothetical protein EVB11_11050 [Winogradskyella sp.]|nr:MAG: hypothetical protein EVB11_11050 [Winogradskyella sp.]
MNREELFLERVNELKERLDSQKEYDILCASNLVFQLILDKNKELANIVNTNDIQIEYSIAESEMYNNMVKMGMTPDTLHTLDGIYPPKAMTRHKVKTVTLDEFMNTVVIRQHGTDYTVNQVIETVTKVLGARHAGDAWKDYESILAKETAKIGGTHITTRQILGIGYVVYDALLPLYEDVKSRV